VLVKSLNSTGYSGSDFAHQIIRDMRAMLFEASAHFARTATLRSPFVRLPAELLAGCAQHLHQRDIINISATCSLLRATLLEIPALWTRAVYIDTASKPLAELLSRSGEMDFDLDVCLGLGKVNTIDAVAETVAQHMPWLRSLSLRLNAGLHRLNAQRVKATRLLQVAAPRLRTCIFLDPHFMYDYGTLSRTHFDAPPLFAQHAPLLTTVKVMGRLNTFLIGGAFSKVRQLLLHPKHELLDLPQLLKVTPALETLGLYCSGGAFIRETTADAFEADMTPHLSELWMRIPHLESMLPIMQSIPHKLLRRACVWTPVGDAKYKVTRTGLALRSVIEVYFEGDTALEAHIRIPPPVEEETDSVHHVTLLLRRTTVSDTERELLVHVVPIGALESVVNLVSRLVLDTLLSATTSRVAHVLGQLGTCGTVTELQVRAVDGQLAISVVQLAGAVFPNLSRLGFYRAIESTTGIHSSHFFELVPETFIRHACALVGGSIIQQVEFVGWTFSEEDRAKLLGDPRLSTQFSVRTVGKDDIPTMWQRMDELSEFFKFCM